VRAKQIFFLAHSRQKPQSKYSVGVCSAVELSPIENTVKSRLSFDLYRFLVKHLYNCLNPRIM